MLCFFKTLNFYSLRLFPRTTIDYKVTLTHDSEDVVLRLRTIKISKCASGKCFFRFIDSSAIHSQVA